MKEYQSGLRSTMTDYFSSFVFCLLALNEANTKELIIILLATSVHRCSSSISPSELVGWVLSEL